jgi:CDP-diacylglycerol--glycerol-3-phosphate 3-phosphatidyltransferase
MGGTSWKERGRPLLAPIVAGLARVGATPTAVTLFGLLLNIVCGVCIARGDLVVGGIVLVVASICDALDGALARATGRVSRFGAFLDSNIDRVDESVVLAGIAAYFMRAAPADAWVAPDIMVVATALALAGSLITSYARARAEGLGLECRVGVLERPERIVLTVLGLFLGYRVLVVAVGVLVVLSWITVAQRIRHVHGILADAPTPSAAQPGRAAPGPGGRD